MGRPTASSRGRKWTDHNHTNLATEAPQSHQWAEVMGGRSLAVSPPNSRTNWPLRGRPPRQMTNLPTAPRALTPKPPPRWLQNNIVHSTQSRRLMPRMAPLIHKRRHMTQGVRAALVPWLGTAVPAYRAAHWKRSRPRSRDGGVGLGLTNPDVVLLMRLPPGMLWLPNKGRESKGIAFGDRARAAAFAEEAFRPLPWHERRNGRTHHSGHPVRHAHFTNYWRNGLQNLRPVHEYHRLQMMRRPRHVHRLLNVCAFGVDDAPVQATSCICLHRLLHRRR